MPMKIITRDFGEQEIEEDKIITFPEGIIGFENVKRYALLSPLGDGVFPMWLQAVDSKEPCFVVYDPMVIYSDYRFVIPMRSRNCSTSTRTRRTAVLQWL